MANEYGDGKAGQYAKSESRKRLEWLWKILLVAAVVGSLIVGVILGFILASQIFFHSHWGKSIDAWKMGWVALVVEMAVLGIVSLCFRALNGPLDRIGRERLKWLRGGQIEGLVAWNLGDLTDEWHIFHNVKLKTGGDLDHVVIGPGGVFCLSTKSQKGLYAVGDDGRYFLNGNRTDHLDEARRLAMKLRSWLEIKLHELPQPHDIPFVQPVLVVPMAYVEFPSLQSGTWIIDDDGLPALLERSRHRLKPRTVAACVQVLQQITGRTPKIASSTTLDGATAGA